MRKCKKLMPMFMLVFMMAAFVSMPIKAASTRTMLTHDVWAYTPSDRVGIQARITVNDSQNIIAGTQGALNYSYSPSTLKEGTVTYTDLTISYDRSIAYCAVSYITTWGERCTETVKFYP